MGTEEQAVLQELLARAMLRPPSIWERPGEVLRFSAGQAYLLLSAEVELFVDQILDPLLRGMVRSTDQHTVSDPQRVRGRILWPATMAARAGQGSTSTLFVCREVRHQYDRPENQLLRALVERLLVGLRVIPSPLRTGLCYEPQPGQMRATPVGPRLERLAAQLRAAGANPRLREVSLPPRISGEHLARADISKHNGYRAAAAIFRRSEALADPARWQETIAALGRRRLILPPAADAAGQVWIDLAALALRG